MRRGTAADLDFEEQRERRVFPHLFPDAPDWEADEEESRERARWELLQNYDRSLA